MQFLCNCVKADSFCLDKEVLLYLEATVKLGLTVTSSHSVTGKNKKQKQTKTIKQVPRGDKKSQSTQLQVQPCNFTHYTIQKAL